MLRTKLFGVPEISIDAQALSTALTGRRLALLAYLLCQEQPAPRSVLSDLLWADLPEEQARDNLRSLLSHTRRVVGDYIVADRQAVTFNRTAPYWADVEAFSTFFVDRQPRADPALLSETLQLYRGEFLAGFYIQEAPVFEGWLLAQRQLWQTQAVQGWQQLAHYHFTQGDDAAGLVANARLLALEPWHEEAHRRQMSMLARSGQRDAALAYFDRCCAILREEVDAPPDEETVAVYKQIKAGVWSLNGTHRTPQVAPIIVTPKAPTQLHIQAPTQNQATNNGHPVAVPPTMPPAPMPPAPMPAATVAPTERSIAIDWGSMPHEPRFHGRQAELARLHQWCVHERRRVVTVLGVGGQGKTALVVRFIRALTEAPMVGKQAAGDKAAPTFERVIWRSLLAAPPLTDILQDWLQQLSDQQVVTRPPTLDQQFTLLHDYLQRRRFLLVLDNIESILLDDGSGACRSGYEAYEQIWQFFAQRDHQCCLLLTSRERPRVFSSHEEQAGTVRTLLLDGLALADGQQLLRTHRVVGDEAAIEALLDCYSGNPLALKLVADTIDELFDGNMEAFLQEETPFFADIGAVLDQQFARLSPLELELLTWLALEQEPIAGETLWHNLVAPPPKRGYLSALRTLVRRSLVQPQGLLFGLQNVILEYTRNRLVNAIGVELTDNQLTGRPADKTYPDRMNAPIVAHPIILSSFNRYALLKAQAKAYIRVGQRRLVLAPIAQRLQEYWGQHRVEAHCQALVAALRMTDQAHTPLTAGYAAGNLLHLLLQMNIALSGYDFSHLTLRQTYLRDLALPGVRFTGAKLQDCLFTDVFAAVTTLAFHPSGEWLAIGTFAGTTRLVRLADGQLHHLLLGHTNAVFGLAISPDGQLLASSSSDQQVRVWDLQTYTLRYCFLETVNFVRAVAFSPDSCWLAVGGGDGTVKIYAATTGALLYTLPSKHPWVCAVAFSPDGHWLVGGGQDGGISLWQTSALTTPLVLAPTHMLRGHTARIETLIFSHDSQLLFSGGRDHLIHLWQLSAAVHVQPGQAAAGTDQPWHTLSGHRDAVRRLALSPDGRYLASGGSDAMVYLWDVRAGTLLDTLVGHEQWVWAVAFHPQVAGATYCLASAGNDQRVLLWEINLQEGGSRSRLQQSLVGYSDAVRSLAFLPNSQLLVSGGFDKLLHIWDVEHRLSHTVLPGHHDWIFSVAVSPDRSLIASAGYERLIYLWPLADLTGVASTEPDLTSAGQARTPLCTSSPLLLAGQNSIITGLAFSPDSQILASCGQDELIFLWDVRRRQRLQTLSWPNCLVWSIAFSPDGRRLASANFDNTVRLWDVQDLIASDRPAATRLLQTFTGHTGLVWMVAFSPDGQTVISTSNDQTVRLWDLGGNPPRVLTGHTNTVRGLAVSPPLVDGHFTLASSDDDKVICLWDGQSGELLHRLQGHHGGIHTLAYSPDGTILASASEQGGIRLWDVQSGTALHTFRAQRPYAGMEITGVTGITPAQKAALLALGAVEQ